jgi:hypothetical protein
MLDLVNLSYMVPFLLLFWDGYYQLLLLLFLWCWLLLL